MHNQDDTLTHLEIPLARPLEASRIASIQTALTSLNGVTAANVNGDRTSLSVTVNADARHGDILNCLEAQQIALAINDIDLRVAGMYCAACATTIEQQFETIEEVRRCSVNVAMGTVHLSVIEGTDEQRLNGAIARAGYRSLGRQSAHYAVDDARRERRRLGIATLVAALLATPIMAIEMGRHLIHDLDFWLMFTPNAYWQVAIGMSVLATLIQFGPGWRFYRHGVPALWRGSPNMDSLVMLGSSAAWGYSTLILFVPQLLPPNSHLLYFESSSMIVTLILFGRYLEAIAKGRTSSAIEKLLAMQASTALRITPQGEEEVAISEINSGERIRIRPGERLPVDGVVEDADAYLDQSMLTGESLPVLRQRGEQVESGSINCGSSFTCRATRVGEHSTLSRIIQIVQRAHASKLPIQSLADRITRRFVPAILLIAVGSLVTWLTLAPPNVAWMMGIVSAISVLVIACPCAMGLATPTSVMVASGEGSRIGLLFQRSTALQQLETIDYAIFDKTGTLTRGKPELHRLIIYHGSETAALGAAAALERHSEHPLGRALINAAQARNINGFSASEVVSTPGKGIAGTVNGQHVVVGGSGAMTTAQIDPQPFEQDVNNAAAQGLTAVFIAVEGRIVALAIIGDRILPTAARTMVALAQQGITPMILSGDHPTTVAAVAEKLGVSDARGGLDPAQKHQAIDQLIAQGHRVVYAGDGINDAPALASATVGIAVGRGTDVAIDAAEIILMHSDPGQLLNAIALSRATMRNIRQNLGWAFGYNVLCIPLAAGLYYSFFEWMLSPQAAACVMALSSLLVVLNALRLRPFKPPFIGAPAVTELLHDDAPYRIADAAHMLAVPEATLTAVAAQNGFDNALQHFASSADISRLCWLALAVQENIPVPQPLPWFSETSSTPLLDLDAIERRISRAITITTRWLENGFDETTAAPSSDTSLKALAANASVSSAMLDHYIATGLLQGAPQQPASADDTRRLALIREARLADVSLETTQTLFDASASELNRREAGLIHLERLGARRDIARRAKDTDPSAHSPTTP
ncbi:Potassium-transporting ATPase ATP-binding subunit [Carnimonas sp. R-84865]